MDKGRSPNVKTTVARRSGRRRTLSEAIDYVANMLAIPVFDLMLGWTNDIQRTRGSEYFTDC